MTKVTTKTKEALPYLDDFLLSLQTNNYSPETVYNYERDLGVLADFINELKLPFTKLDKKAIDRYKAYLTSRDRRTSTKHNLGVRLKSYSINRMLSSLRAYLRYLIELDHPTPLPPEAVKLVKTERKHPQVAELNELVKLIESPSTLENDQIIADRNRAMLEMLFSTGMRISELKCLRVKDIDFGAGLIFIRSGKGDKDRSTILPEYLKNELRAHIKEVKKMHDDDIYPRNTRYY